MSKYIITGINGVELKSDSLDIDYLVNDSLFRGGNNITKNKHYYEKCKTCVGHMVYQCENVCSEENGFMGYIQEPKTKQLYLLKRDGRCWAKGNIDYINEVIKSAMEYDGIEELNITIERLEKK